jgi:hypothetical protein
LAQVAQAQHQELLKALLETTLYLAQSLHQAVVAQGHLRQIQDYLAVLVVAQLPRVEAHNLEEQAHQTKVLLVAQ